MAGLRLAKLPERVPVKLAITVMPELHQRLQDYAVAYAAAYQNDEPLTELIPAMLAAFLDSDREFSRHRK
ncbi:DUF2274 domain-containing protein [Sphingomonas koreensis]|nr:DUF2274 domain-containing protein [Sphingomonas koreensis]